MSCALCPQANGSPSKLRMVDRVPTTVFLICLEWLWYNDNVGKTIVNHPFGNALYHLFIVIWWMVYYYCTHIIAVTININ